MYFVFFTQTWLLEALWLGLCAIINLLTLTLPSLRVDVVVTTVGRYCWGSRRCSSWCRRSVSRILCVLAGRPWRCRARGSSRHSSTFQTRRDPEISQNNGSRDSDHTHLWYLVVTRNRHLKSAELRGYGRQCTAGWRSIVQHVPDTLRSTSSSHVIRQSQRSGFASSSSTSRVGGRDW